MNNFENSIYKNFTLCYTHFNIYCSEKTRRKGLLYGGSWFFRRPMSNIKIKGGYALQYIISFMVHDHLEIVDESNLGFFLKEGQLFIQNISLPSPFLFQRNQIFMRSMMEEYYVYESGKQLAGDVPLQHGGFFQIAHKQSGFSYSILIQDRASVPVKHALFHLNTDVVIGRGGTAQISSSLCSAMSSAHAMIKLNRKGSVIEDISKKAGLYVNGRKYTSKLLYLGDVIWCMGVTVVYMGSYLAVSQNATVLLSPCSAPIAKIEEIKYSAESFERSPRIIRTLEAGVQEIDPPTQKNQQKTVPLLLSIGPSLTMSMAMMVSLSVAVYNASNGGSMTTIITSGAMAVSMLLGAVMWPMLMKKHQTKEALALEELRQEKYAAYIQKTSEKLKGQYKRNKEIWNDHLAPSPEKIANFPKAFAQDGNHLWERKSSDVDFLDFRLGIGEHPFEVDIKIPKVGFSLDDDQLKTYPQRVQQQFKILKDVPVMLSLQREKLVGVFGATDIYYQLLQSLILQTMSHYSPEEVKTVFFFSEYEKDAFLWMKELPSVWSNDRSIRFMATNSDEAHEVLSYLDEKLGDEANTEVYLLFVTNKSLLDKDKIGLLAQHPDNELAMYTVFFSPKISGLPKNTNAIIRCFPDKLGFYSKTNNETTFVTCKPDALPMEVLGQFRDDIMKVPLTLESSKLGIPERVGFLEMYRAGNIETLHIEEKWLSNRSHKSLATPIGLTTGSDVFQLDIHESYHGCHGLVAGTTGSGKTEFLQEFILSLMVNYSPNEINFVLVDFKGGDMARPFLKSSRGVGENEPHVAATITNLSTNMLYRALTSLKAEIQYRQRVFNEAAGQLEIDKIDINSYQQYMKEGRLSLPLPHLVVVIDEFAQLKTQFPDFLQELINVAQVGRSLGIHLILATQKPSGVVDPQIWSNARFRVCLKVSDKQDSAEMINLPNAASIKQPGRCFVQVGYDELFAEVQTGYSGLEYVRSEKFINSEDLNVDLVDYSATKIASKKIKSGQERTERSQIEAVVAELKKIGQQYHYQTRQLWAPLLPEKIALTEISDTVGKKEVILGLVDDIRNQKQYSLTLDFAKMQHVLIYGMSGQGKTTLLQTILYQLFCKNSNEEFEAYVFDFAGPSMNYFKNIQQVSGYTDVNNEVEIQDMLERLTEEIENRKNKFQEENCTSFTEYNRKHKLSQIVVVIDNYGPWNDRYYKFQDTVRDILASSVSCGITFLVTNASKSGVPSKIIEHFTKIITYKMPDRSDYRDLFRVQVPVTPEEVLGRCLLAVGKDICELQTALIISGDSEANRVKHILATLPAKTSAVSGRREVREARKPVPKASTVASASTTKIPRKVKIDSLDFSNGLFISGTDPLDILKIAWVVAMVSPPDVILSQDPNGDFQKTGVPVFWGEEVIDGVLEEVANKIRNRKEVPCPVTTIMIPSFSEFFEVVSDAKLQLIEIMLKQHGDLVKVITGDSVQKLNAFTGTQFFTLTAKHTQGIITNPEELTNIMSYLHQDLIPPKLPANFPYLLWYQGEQWNTLEVGGN